MQELNAFGDMQKTII